jgi:hypothetical protein
MHALILGEVAACHSIWQAHWQQVRRLLEDKAGGPKSGRVPKELPLRVVAQEFPIVENRALFTKSCIVSATRPLYFGRILLILQIQTDPEATAGHS